MTANFVKLVYFFIRMTGRRIIKIDVGDYDLSAQINKR